MTTAHDSDEMFVRTLREAVRVGRQDGPCPGGEALARLHARLVNAEEEEQLQLHLTACAPCASLFEALVDTCKQAKPMPTADPKESERPPSFLERLRDLVSFEMPGAIALTTRAAAVQKCEGYEKAMEAYRGGSYDEALEALEATLAGGESFPALRFYLGACLMNAGRSGDAVEHLRLAVEGAPKMAEYRLAYSQALLLTGEGEEAEKQLLRTARLPGRRKARAKELAKQVRSVLDASHG